MAGRYQRGFTLVEMVTIIVILGIIAVVAVPRFADTDTFRSRAAADQAIAALRYAQKVAIASHSNVTVNISAGTPADCGIAVAAGTLNCVVNNDVTVVPAPAIVVFDFMGRPVPNVVTPVAVGGTAITIEAETGYVR